MLTTVYNRSPANRALSFNMMHTTLINFNTYIVYKQLSHT